MKPLKQPLPPPVSNARVCIGCGADMGADGPLGFACDVHVRPHGLVITCSAKCRAELGLPERKAVSP